MAFSRATYFIMFYRRGYYSAVTIREEKRVKEFVLQMKVFDDNHGFILLKASRFQISILYYYERNVALVKMCAEKTCVLMDFEICY